MIDSFTKRITDRVKKLTWLGTKRWFRQAIAKSVVYNWCFVLSVLALIIYNPDILKFFGLDFIPDSISKNLGSNLLTEAIGLTIGLTLIAKALDIRDKQRSSAARFIAYSEVNRILARFCGLWMTIIKYSNIAHIPTSNQPFSADYVDFVKNHFNPEVLHRHVAPERVWYQHLLEYSQEASRDVDRVITRYLPYLQPDCVFALGRFEEMLLLKSFAAYPGIRDYYLRHGHGIMPSLPLPDDVRTDMDKIERLHSVLMRQAYEFEHFEGFHPPFDIYSAEEIEEIKAGRVNAPMIFG